MPRAFAAIIVLMMCLDATTVAGCDEYRHVADRSLGVQILPDIEGAAESDADCCADCYCCARVFDNAYRTPEREFLPIYSRSDSLTFRLVEGHFTPPYHPPQVAA